MQREFTGEEDLLKVKEIEVIFNDVNYIDSLENTPNLKSLTCPFRCVRAVAGCAVLAAACFSPFRDTLAVIQTGLMKLSGLAPVGHSLMRLVITEQKITRMENLFLPNLRDLLLHCNDIVRMEGLTGCPRLQRLWLYSNRIAKIENLDGVPDLRELWLQVLPRSLHFLDLM